MFSSRLVTPADLKEAAKRARVKQIEEERRPRIFDVKKRMIGIDISAIDRQVEERKAQMAALKAEEEAYLAFQKNEDKYLREEEMRLAEEKKKQIIELMHFRKHYQKKELRREFDLNDPEALKKDIPCRLGDDDPRLTISSMQRFEGEQGSAQERLRIQSEQQKVWLAQQIKEKKRDEHERKALDQQLRETYVTLDDRVKELIAMEEKCKRERAKAITEYNRLMAREKADQMKIQQRKEREDTMMHINNTLNSEMLAEYNMGTASNLGVNKIVAATYRGLSEKEKAELKEYQKQQIDEYKERRRQEDLLEKSWLDLTAEFQSRVEQKDNAIKEEKKKLEQELIEENRKLAEIQKAHHKYLDKTIYNAGAPSAAFYAQFNKGTR